jgi:hypothetical protein
VAIAAAGDRFAGNVFIAEAFRHPPEVPGIACASVIETAADKFVALTRRAGAELAGLDEPIPRLCGICMICMRCANIAIRSKWLHWLTKSWRRMPRPTETGFRPIALIRSARETHRAVEKLVSGAGYRQRYEDFQRFMVYCEIY